MEVRLGTLFTAHRFRSQRMIKIPTHDLQPWLLRTRNHDCGLKVSWLYYLVAGLKLSVCKLPLARKAWPSAFVSSIRKEYL